MDEILQRLYARRTFGIKPGLGVEEALLRRLGNPERSFAVIHVAGTNGKGSVCALLDSILRAAGLPVGLYTSPHLVRLNERFRVGGRPMDDAALLERIAELEPVAAQVAAETGSEPTFFEFTTALGFEHFRREGVKVAVVEVGLGGRLDATNVVRPLVSVITRLSLEHTEYLGPDLESIAREKGGIIKDGRPVVCGAMPAEALGVLREVAAARRAPLTDSAEAVSVRRVSEDLSGQKVQLETESRSYGTLRLPLLGRHQLENLATAAAVVDVLAEPCGIELPEDAVKEGVAGARWPGRLQVLAQDPPVLLDGAHNPGAGEVLAESVKGLLKKRPLALVVGMCGDKDAGEFLGAFTGIAKRLWLVPIQNERNMAPAKLAAAARAARMEPQHASVAEALSGAREWAARESGAVLITGSLYLVGEVLALTEGGGPISPG